MEIIIRKVAELRFAPWNPNTMDPADRIALRRSIEEFGAVDPAIVNRHEDPELENLVLGGEHRIRVVSEDLGWDVYPTVEVTLDADRAKALNVALNRIHGRLDDVRLAALLASISDSEVVALTGLREDEVADLLARVREPEAPTSFEPRDPSTEKFDHKCPSCGYEWSGAPT